MICRDKKSTSKSLQALQTPFLIFSLFLILSSLAYPSYASGNQEQFNATNTNTSLPDLLVERITIPAVIYATEDNPIIISIKNEGGNFSGDFNVSLRAENISETRTKNGSSRPNVLNLSLAPIPEKEKKVVYIKYNFTNLTQNVSLILKIDPDGRIEEKNKENNNATLNITTHQKLYDFNYSAKVKDATAKALAYLKNEKDEEGKINDFYSSCLALSSISLYEEPDQDLINYLNTNCTQIINSTDATDWAIATLAIASLGENPRNFSNINFVGSLNSFFDGEQIGYEGRLDDDCFALLALSAAGGGKIKIVNRTVANLVEKQEIVGGWNMYGGNSSSVADTSLAIQAILSTGLVSSEDASIRKAIEFVKSNQNENGSFPYNEKGEEGSSIPTALALSALLASNRSENKDSIKNATDYLLKVQNEEGYFHDYNRIKSTSYALIALSGGSIPSFHQIGINRVLPEVYPIAFTVRPKGASENGTLNDTAYANVTSDVIARIRNNGGAFNLSFIEDGETLQERRVIEKRSTAETEVKFEWKPIHTGRYNLTISADTKEEIEEANEGNNTIGKEIRVMLPDLHPDLSSIGNKTFYSNFSNDFPIEVKGFGENFNSSLLINFVDNITNNPTDNLPNITCSGEKLLNFTWKPEFKRNYSFKVTIDCDDDVKESDEENNTGVGEVNVTLPDLLPCNISFLPPANASFKNKFLLVNKSNLINVSLKGAGESFNVSLHAYHLGDNETEVNNLTGLTNLTNDTSIFLIEKKKIPRILGAENVSFSWIPGEKGFYRVFTVVDADNEVYEENETNNLRYADIEVIAGAPEIRLINPRGGETFINADYIDVRWNATDPDYDPLNISISYSPDCGGSWIKIAGDEENDGRYSWCIKDMPDGEYMLTVEASDGDFTDSDTTVEPFTICNKESHEEAPQFHYNAGFSLSEAPDTNTIAWNTTDIGAVDSSQPIVAEGKVFVYCDNESGTFLVALNESDGKFIRKWGLDKRQYGSWSSPGYHDGMVFIGSGKKISAIDAGSGEEKWVATLPKKVVNSCPTIESGKVFIGGYGADGDPEYYCLDEENGTTLWVFNETDAREIANITNPRATATTAFYEGKVFAGFGSGIIGSSGAPGAIYCLHGNGTRAWYSITDYGVWGSITPIHGILYFGTYNFDGDATYYAMYPADGGVKWKKGGIRTDSTPAYAYGNMYISGGCMGYSDIAIYCLNPENGGEIWKVEDIGGWTASPVVSSDGKLIVGKIGKGGDASAADGTYCLNAVTGEEIWNSSFGGSTAVIANGRVYTIGQGKVWCFGSLYTPDLNISSFDAPGKVCAGENVLVNVTVKNIGDGDVNESFNVSLRANGEDVGRETISSLNTSEEKKVNFRWAAKEEDVGTCRLVAEVDSDDKITEKNPLNNKAFGDVKVNKKPDLIVKAIEALNKAYIGQEIIIKTDIENIGGEIEEAFSVSFNVSDGTHEEETTSLQNSITLYFTWTSFTTGNYTLTITADSGNVIKESNENNNNKSEMIDIITKEEEPTSPSGFGPGSHGGHGGWSAGGIGAESGIGEAGAGEAGGMQIPVNASGSAGETKKEVSGYPFGNISSGASGGGGTLPLLFVALLVLTIALFYFGYYKEKRAHAKHISPRAYRRDKR